MRKILSVAAFSALITLAACGTSADSAAPITNTSSSMSVATDQARVISISVDNWQFTPNTITLHTGEKVAVRLTTIAGIHSFQSRDLGIDVSLNPGDTKEVLIPTDTAGTFHFRCSVPCGEGHDDMTGTIIIE